MSRITRRPSPALFVAALALVAALAGTAIAGPEASTSVSKKKVKKIAKKEAKKQINKVLPLEAGDLADGSVERDKIADGAIDGSKVADDSIGSEKLSDIEVSGNSFIQVSATNGANEAAARAAAPENPLLSKGPLEVYAKCFRDTGGNETLGEIYARTAQDRSILDGPVDNLSGGPAAADFLNTNTAEVNRQINTGSVTGNNAFYSEGEAALGAPDLTALNLVTAIGVRSGALAGDGPYGPGNSCVFSAAALG
jgi:hypothetical protein